MAKYLSVVVAVAGLLASAGIALYPQRDAELPELKELTSSADARIAEVAAGVHARVTTLADLPQLANAVATDAATVTNLTQNELAFRAKPGETIEIGQVSTAGKPESLLRIPSAGPAATLEESGVHLHVIGDRLMLTEVVSVRPTERADELRGAVAVSWWVELAPVAARLGTLGWAGKIVIGAAAIPLGTAVFREGDRTMALPLGGAAQGAKLLVAVHKASDGHSLLFSGLLALMTVVASTLLWRRGRAAVRLEPLKDLGSAGTELAMSPNLQIRSGKDGGLVSGPSLWPSRAGSPLQIGRYTVLSSLGAGGMAEVFLARVHGEAGFEKLVALKVLHPKLASTPMVVDHFLDEARLASRLTHPNIVQIIDLGRADDAYFIAMEYVDGSDLEGLLQSCRARGIRVPVPVAITIVRKICDGLQAAHTAVDADGRPLEIVHRDVKTANVFVARNGAVKVGDFGIAKTSSAERVAKTEIGQVKGTAAYMAPEHRTGEVVDRRADLYGVGAIAYELLSGQEINLDLMVLAHKGREGWPHLPRVTELHPELPPELDEVVRKALAFDKEARYPSCDALEAALEVIASRHSFIASDKVVAQFVETELAARGKSAVSAAQR